MGWDGDHDCLSLEVSLPSSSELRLHCWLNQHILGEPFENLLPVGFWLCMGGACWGCCHIEYKKLYSFPRDFEGISEQSCFREFSSSVGSFDQSLYVTTNKLMLLISIICTFSS